MNSKKYVWLNKVLFANRISKFKSEDFRSYLQDLLLVKNLLIKLLAFIIIGLVVMGLSFIVRQIFIDNYPDKIVPNPGISFSAFANASPAVIYLIQAIPCVLTFSIFLFLNDKLIYSSLLIVFFGGLSNIVDRALPLDLIVGGGISFPSNAVVDYIPLIRTYANLPDIFISVGAGLAVLSLIIYIVKVYRAEKNKPDETKDASATPAETQSISHEQKN